jgi:peroxiredoxin family protein
MEGVLAAILESGDPERLYTGFSLLVSAASAGEEVRALLGFGALRALNDPELVADGPFGNTLRELRAAADELPSCRVSACSAAVQETGVTHPDVTSMPAFLREIGDARLVFV